MKKYFLGFDFHNRYLNKFYFGIIDIDLGQSDILDVAKQLIEQNFADVNPESVTIKVTVLNNIEI